MARARIMTARRKSIREGWDRAAAWNWAQRVKADQLAGKRRREREARQAKPVQQPWEGREERIAAARAMGI